MIRIFLLACQGRKCRARKRLPLPAQFSAEFFFVIHQAVVAEKDHAGISVILQGQVPAERPALPALDTVKVRFGGEIRTDDLLANVAGAYDRIQQLALV